MQIRMRDGRLLQGTPKQIVEQMKYVAFGHEHRDLSEYIDWVAGELLRMESIALEIQGDTDDEKAASLVQGMLGAGLALKIKAPRASSTQ